jgi:DNA invertase Pin-like site-specific DNA recombinase
MTESEPQNRRLGYARVSTYGQTLDSQIAQLRAEGCDRIYREKASGAALLQEIIIERVSRVR